LAQAVNHHVGICSMIRSRGWSRTGQDKYGALLQYTMNTTNTTNTTGHYEDYGHYTPPYATLSRRHYTTLHYTTEYGHTHTHTGTWGLKTTPTKSRPAKDSVDRLNALSADAVATGYLDSPHPPSTFAPVESTAQQTATHRDSTA
jgi:hypothetical protein